MIETLVVVYTTGALITAGLVAWFDGGHDYKEQWCRYGTYTKKYNTIRRNGETGVHALGRIIAKGVGWPALACVYLLKPFFRHIYRWLTEEHEPERP